MVRYPADGPNLMDPGILPAVEVTDVEEWVGVLQKPGIPFPAHRVDSRTRLGGSAIHSNRLHQRPSRILHPELVTPPVRPSKGHGQGLVELEKTKVRGHDDAPPQGVLQGQPPHQKLHRLRPPHAAAEVLLQSADERRHPPWFRHIPFLGP